VAGPHTPLPFPPSSPHHPAQVLVPASAGLDILPASDDCVHTVVTGDTLFALAQVCVSVCVYVEGGGGDLRCHPWPQGSQCWLLCPPC
jgi:hypothetical protein